MFQLPSPCALDFGSLIASAAASATRSRLSGQALNFNVVAANDAGSCSRARGFCWAVLSAWRRSVEQTRRETSRQQLQILCKEFARYRGYIADPEEREDILRSTWHIWASLAAVSVARSRLGNLTIQMWWARELLADKHAAAFRRKLLVHAVAAWAAELEPRRARARVRLHRRRWLLNTAFSTWRKRCDSDRLPQQQGDAFIEYSIALRQRALSMQMHEFPAHRQPTFHAFPLHVEAAASWELRDELFDVKTDHHRLGVLPTVLPLPSYQQHSITCFGGTPVRAEA